VYVVVEAVSPVSEEFVDCSRKMLVRAFTGPYPVVGGFFDSDFEEEVVAVASVGPAFLRWFTRPTTLALRARF